MNEKEVSEIRRRFKPDKSNITSICGCYVNDKKEIVSTFNQSINIMPEDESEKFLAILKKTLSGTLNKNLIDIEFTTQQVVDSPEHGLLMQLREKKLKDENALNTFFENVIKSVSLSEHYLIILAYDTYDLPYQAKDGSELSDASSEVFSYILCSICPIKMRKPALEFYAYENQFRSCTIDWIVSPPELGFMFPAFDERSTNIYNSLYYTRNIAENHEEFIETIFNTEIPMPAAVQKETFQTILSGTLENECNFDTVQTVHNKIQEIIEEHKENKVSEPLVVSKNTVKQILKASAVPDTNITAFEKEFDTQFGAETALSPKNIVDTKQIEVAAPGVKIRIDSQRDDLIETRMIDGRKYILIKAEEGVELNGIPINIS